jgi:hypothetical protein
VASNNASNRKLTKAATANTGYGKAGKQSALSNFPTATTTTNYNPVWDTILRARSTVAIGSLQGHLGR